MSNRLIEKLENCPSKNALVFIALFSGAFMTLLIGFMMPVITKATQVSPYGILSLEFPWTANKMDLMISAWSDGDPNLISGWLNVTIIDFFFLIAYGFFFSSMNLLNSRKYPKSKFKTFSYWLTFTPLLAAFFDILENITLIVILSSPSSYAISLPTFTSIFALLKFILFIPPVANVIIGGFYLIIKKLNLHLQSKKKKQLNIPKNNQKKDIV